MQITTTRGEVRIWSQGVEEVNEGVALVGVAVLVDGSNVVTARIFSKEWVVEYNRSSSTEMTPRDARYEYPETTTSANGEPGKGSSSSGRNSPPSSSKHNLV